MIVANTSHLIEGLLHNAELLSKETLIAPDLALYETVNVTEVLTGFYAINDEKRAAKTKSLLQDLTQNDFTIVALTFKIADLAASLRAKRGGRLPDAIIAATAIDQAADFIYSQDEDLQRFSEDIKVLKLEQNQTLA